MITIYEDNAGNILIVYGRPWIDLVEDCYAHWYDNVEQAVEDIWAYLEEPDTSAWNQDGNEREWILFHRMTDKDHTHYWDIDEFINIEDPQEAQMGHSAEELWTLLVLKIEKESNNLPEALKEILIEKEEIE